jgi:predicted membrane protein
MKRAGVALFILILLANFFALFLHNRLNAFLYVLLAAGYALLEGAPRDWRLRLIFIFAPQLFALYYGDFRLLWMALTADAVLTGGLLYCEKKE